MTNKIKLIVGFGIVEMRLTHWIWKRKKDLDSTNKINPL